MRNNPSMRRNVAIPIGVGKDEMRKIISTPFGKHPLDKYIREENLPLPKRNKDNEGGKAIPDVAKAMLYLRKSLLPRSLFGSSTKTAKSDGSTAEVRVIYLQPHTKSSEPMPKGRPFKKYAPDFNELAECDRLYPITVEMPKRKRNPDTCPFAGECSKVCLIASGQLGKEDAHFAGYMKTWLWFLHPVVFLRQLILECKKEGKRSAKYGYDFFARLNGTSDITWERYIAMDKMVKDFVGLKGFYDYTKWTYEARIRSAKLGGKLPKHYDLTFSMSEAEEITGGKYSAEAEAAKWLAQGGRVAVVVQEYRRYPDTGERGKVLRKSLIKSGATKGKYRNEYWAITDYSDLAKHAANAPIPKNRTHPLIIDGDQSDFRFNDPPHSIVILKPKGIYVDEQGRVYVTDSAYSEGRKYLTPKSRAFIKSAEYVLNLQDRILHSLGKGSKKEQIVAKNPRQKNIFTGNYEEWKSITEKLEKDVQKASDKLQKMMKGKKGAMGLLPQSVQKSPAYKKAKSDFDKAFFSSQQFQISVPLKKRKQFQNKRSKEYRKAKWGLSNPRNNPQDWNYGVFKDGKWHDEDTGFWVGFSISKEDVIVIREDEDGYYKVSMKRFIDMVGKDYDHEEWDRHEEGNPTHWLTHEEWKKLLPKPYKFPSSGEQIYQDLNNNPSPDLLDVLQEAISKGNTPFQESKLLTDALEKHTGHPTQGFKLEQELEIPQEKGKPSILNFYLFPNAPFGNDMFHLVLSSGKDNQGRIALFADISGYENLNKERMANLESVVKAFSDRHGRPPHLIQKAKLPSRPQDLLEIDAEMFDLFAPQIDQRVKELEGKRGNYVQALLWIVALVPLAWDGIKYLLKKGKKSPSSMKEKKKNPHSEKIYLITIDEKIGDGEMSYTIQAKSEAEAKRVFMQEYSRPHRLGRAKITIKPYKAKNPEYVSRSTRLITPMGATAESEDIAGVASIPQKGGYWFSIYLYDLNDYDKKVYAHVPLKTGEQLFRYRSDSTHYVEPESAYLVKINVDRDLLYFMTQEGMEKDIPEFKTRGIKLKSLKLYTHDNPRKKKMSKEELDKWMFPWFHENFRIFEDSANRLSSPSEEVWISPKLGFKLIRKKMSGIPYPFRWEHSSGATGYGKFLPTVIEQMKKVKKKNPEHPVDAPNRPVGFSVDIDLEDYDEEPMKSVMYRTKGDHETYYFTVDTPRGEVEVVSMKKWLDSRQPMLLQGRINKELRKILLHKAKNSMSVERLMDGQSLTGFEELYRWLYENDIRVTTQGISSRDYDRQNPLGRNNPSIPQEVQEKIQYFSQSDQGKSFYAGAGRRELVDMMNGSKHPDIVYMKDYHYKGWKPEHFRMLMKEVDKFLVPECKKKALARIIDVVEDYGKCDRKNPREFQPQQAFDKMFDVLSKTASKKIAKKDVKDSWVEKKYILEKSKFTLGDDLPKR